jgi:hypothetical protein
MSAAALNEHQKSTVERGVALLGRDAQRYEAARDGAPKVSQDDAIIKLSWQH